MICLTGGCLRIAILKLEHESESTSGVVKTKIDEPFPEFLIHSVWGRAHESSVLVKFSSGADTIGSGTITGELHSLHGFRTSLPGSTLPPSDCNAVLLDLF